MKLKPIEKLTNAPASMFNVILHCSECPNSTKYQNAVQAGWMFNPSKKHEYYCASCKKKQK